MLFQPNEIPKHKDKIKNLAKDPEWIKRYKNKSLAMWETSISAHPYCINLVEDEDLTNALVQLAADHYEFNETNSYRNENFINTLNDLSLNEFTNKIITTLKAKGCNVSKLINSKIPCAAFDEEMADIIVSESLGSTHPRMPDFPEQYKIHLGRRLFSVDYYQDIKPIPKETLIYALGQNIDKWAHNISSNQNSLGFKAVAKIINDNHLDDLEFLDTLASTGFLFMLDKELHTKERVLLAAQNENFTKWCNHYRNTDIISEMQVYWTPANIIKHVTSNKNALRQVRRIYKYLTDVDMYVYEDIQKKALAYDIKNIIQVNDNFNISDEMVAIFASQFPNELRDLPSESIKPEHVYIALNVQSNAVLDLPYKLENAKEYLEYAFKATPNLLNNIELTFENEVFLRRHLTQEIASTIATHSPDLYAQIVSKESLFTKQDVMHVLKVCPSAGTTLLCFESLQKEPYLSQVALYFPSSFVEWANHRGQGLVMGTLKLNTQRFQNAVDNHPELIRVIAKYASINDLVSVSQGLKVFSLEAVS